MDSAARARYWIGLGLALALASGCASPPKPEAAGSDLGQRMMGYYAAPDPAVVESLLEALDEPPISTEPGAPPGVVGFLASVFEADPDLVPAVLERPFGKSGQVIVAQSLRYGGRPEQAAEYLRRNGWAQQAVDDLARSPTALEDVVVAQIYDLDLLWGAFFASGDLTFVEKILAFAVSPSSSGVPLRDVLEIVILTTDVQRGDPSGAKAQRLRERYSRLGEEGAQRVSYAATAMWAVGSNAGQHPLIADHLERRISQSPDSPDALFLRWAVFQRDYPDRVATLDGESAWAAMLTVRSRGAAQALVDDWSVPNLKAGGIREFERGASPIVVLVVHNKLRCQGEYHLVLTEPGGGVHEYARVSLESVESPIQYSITTLSPSDLPVAGSYEYSLHIRACGMLVPPISNGLFVY